MSLFLWGVGGAALVFIAVRLTLAALKKKDPPDPLQEGAWKKGWRTTQDAWQSIGVSLGILALASLLPILLRPSIVDPSRSQTEEQILAAIASIATSVFGIVAVFLGSVVLALKTQRDEARSLVRAQAELADFSAYVRGDKTVTYLVVKNDGPPGDFGAMLKELGGGKPEQRPHTQWPIPWRDHQNDEYCFIGTGQSKYLKVAHQPDKHYIYFFTLNEERMVDNGTNPGAPLADGNLTKTSDRADCRLPQRAFRGQEVRSRNKGSLRIHRGK